MPNRILKDSICTSDSIDQLSDKAEILFYRLIVQCDDHGLFDGRASIIRAKCFPLKIDAVKEKDIDKWLNELVAVGMVYKYQSNDKPYVGMRSWGDNQQTRATHSKYPIPTADDINRYQMISVDCKCPRESNRIESESNQNRINAGGTNNAFDVFWSAYPKKVGKGAAVKAWNQVKPDDDMIAKIHTALERQKQSDQWRKSSGQFIPNPTTWLNQCRWDDEPVMVISEAERILNL